MPPRGPKKVTRRIHVLLETPQDLPEKPTSFDKYGKSMSLALSPFRIRCAVEASRWPQDGPRELQQ
eukprot:3572838-Pyramimonas_sp.AAC.1